MVQIRQLDSRGSASAAGAALRSRAEAVGTRIVDLSVGNPVGPVPEVVRDALAQGAQSPGYPSARGTLNARRAYTRWLSRQMGVTGLDPETQVLAVSGSKEMVALLPCALGLGAGSAVLQPELAYPTYAIGASVAGARLGTYSAHGRFDPDTRLLWVNTPNNPSGDVLSAQVLRAALAACRERGAVLASDEAYLELVWAGRATSVLDESVSGPHRTGVIALHSLSKRSNMAGYRAAFMAGDADLIDVVARFREQVGLLVPGPVQHAMRAALDDDSHVEAQHAIYQRRRNMLATALHTSGFRIDGSAAGPFLWCTRGETDSATAAWFANLAVLAVPGSLYGKSGARHVRLALTASDDDIAEAAQRISVGVSEQTKAELA